MNNINYKVQFDISAKRYTVRVIYLKKWSGHAKISEKLLELLRVPASHPSRAPIKCLLGVGFTEHVRCVGTSPDCNNIIISNARINGSRYVLNTDKRTRTKMRKKKLIFDMPVRRIALYYYCVEARVLRVRTFSLFFFSF